ncbi:MAG: ribonuclease [Stomatobaculum sp.]|nr:ribonuclease [Stomatobaculum sp.]
MFLLGACTTQKPAVQQSSNTPSPVQSTEAPTFPAAAETLHLIEEESTPEESLPPAAGITQAMIEGEQSSEGKDPEYDLTETAVPLPVETVQETTAAGVAVHESGNYTSKDEVALYIHLYGHLPSNYISKRKAEERGWDSKAGNLDDVLPGMSIGGSGFGNYEGLLPAKKGRKYYECDIDYTGGHRNAKRIIYSNDGLVFYTENHYKSFEQLY